jgi:drug/metabolite transporter (DMT)-like permease
VDHAKRALTRQNRAYVMALGAVLCWSTVASAFKLTLRVTDPVPMLLYSALVSALFLAGAVIVSSGPKGFRRIFPTPRAWADSALNGLLNPFLYYLVLFHAYRLLPAQEAQPLNYTWPIMVVLLSAPMLGQRLRPLSLLAILVSFAGVLVISTQGNVFSLRFTNGPGALLALGSSLIWATYWLRNVRDRRGPVPKLAGNFLFGALYIFVYANMLGPGASISRAGLLGCIYIGLFEMGIAFLLWLRALTLSETSAKVSNLVFLSPFISLVFIRYVVGEKILASSILGLAVIVLGIWIQGRAR